MDQSWAIRHALVTALSDWLGARQRLAVFDRLGADQDRLLALERQRVAAGEDAASELVVGQQMRIEIEQQQAELRAVADTAEAATAKALGLPPQALDGMKVSWPDWGEPVSVAEDELRE